MLGGIRLEDVTVGAQRPGLLHIGCRRLDGKKNKFGRNPGGSELGRGFETIHNGHADIGDDEIRLEPLPSLNQGRSILDAADDVVVRLEELLNLLEHGGMVISQQNPFSTVGLHSRSFYRNGTGVVRDGRLGFSLISHSGIRPC